ncbi:hypothetical protein ABPG75_009374 [Micractinium tetrahymenae]
MVSATFKLWDTDRASFDAAVFLDFVNQYTNGARNLTINSTTEGTETFDDPNLGSMTVNILQVVFTAKYPPCGPLPDATAFADDLAGQPGWLIVETVPAAAGALAAAAQAISATAAAPAASTVALTTTSQPISAASKTLASATAKPLSAAAATPIPSSPETLTPAPAPVPSAA